MTAEEVKTLGTGDIIRHLKTGIPLMVLEGTTSELGLSDDITITHAEAESYRITWQKGARKR